MTYEEFLKIAEESISALPDYTYEMDKDSFNINRDDIIVQKHISSGADGGNCWGSEAQYFSNSKSAQEFIPLDRILKAACPSISYLKYKEIQSLIKEDSYTDHEYYGNYTYYEVYKLNIKELYDWLFLNECFN